MIDINSTTAAVSEKATSILFNPSYLIAGIIFIIAAIVILYFLKNILLNSVVGVFGFLVCYFVFGVKLPFFLTLLVSAIFGIGGLGTIILLKFFGVF
jgi:hypothetical protein